MTTFDPLTLLLGFLGSFLACFLSTLAGGGAGFILLPVLLLLGLPFPNALACHKLAVTCIGIGGALRFSREGLIDRRMFFLVGLSGIPMVLAGTVFSGKADGDTMKPLIGVLTLAFVIYQFFRPEQTKVRTDKELTNARIGRLLLFLMPAAFYTGWLSAGAGILLVLITYQCSAMISYKRRR